MVTKQIFILILISLILNSCANNTIRDPQSDENNSLVWLNNSQPQQINDNDDKHYEEMVAIKDTSVSNNRKYTIDLVNYEIEISSKEELNIFQFCNKLIELKNSFGEYTIIGDLQRISNEYIPFFQSEASLSLGDTLLKNNNYTYMFKSGLSWKQDTLYTVPEDSFKSQEEFMKLVTEHLSRSIDQMSSVEIWNDLDYPPSWTTIKSDTVSCEVSLSKKDSEESGPAQKIIIENFQGQWRFISENCRKVKLTSSQHHLYFCGEDKSISIKNVWESITGVNILEN